MTNKRPVLEEIFLISTQVRLNTHLKLVANSNKRKRTNFVTNSRIFVSEKFTFLTLFVTIAYFTIAIKTPTQKLVFK